MFNVGYLMEVPDLTLQMKLFTTLIMSLNMQELRTFL
ncbi:UNVERIFIED_CONTAM: hypothetical protein GTU68_017047 [Idotea baltica]|nr:hypothetical protein [Idotea baltica]